jgi:hypothetical protein
MSTSKLILAAAAGAVLLGASIAAHADDGRGGGHGPWNYGWYPGCCVYGYAVPYAYYPQPYYYPQQYYYQPQAYGYPPPAYGYVVP